MIRTMVREFTDKILQVRPTTTYSLTIMEITTDYVALMVTTTVPTA